MTDIWMVEIVGGYLADGGYLNDGGYPVDGGFPDNGGYPGIWLSGYRTDEEYPPDDRYLANG